MVISFAGAQSTGKSTLLEAVTGNEIFKSYKFIPEVTRLVKKKYKLDINEKGDGMTQLAILNAHLDNYLQNRDCNVVMDRCILDGLVYTTYQYHTGKVDPETMLYCEFLFKKLISKVDIIFYTEPDIPLVDDGERSNDITFRETIIKLFETAIEHYKINVVRLKGTVEERLKVIYNTIDNYGK